MSLFSKNMNFFKHKYPDVYESISEPLSKFDTTVEPVLDDEGKTVNFVVEGNSSRCFIHSIFDENRFFERMYGDIADDAQVVVIYGMGMSCKYALKKFKRIKYLFIIEPDINLLKKLMEVVDYLKIGSDTEKVFFVCDRRISVSKYLLSLNTGILKDGIKLAFSPAYRSLYGDYFETVKKDVSDALKSIVVREADVNDHVEMWTSNTLKNAGVKAVCLDRFRNKFSGIPAVIVSAGPSLTDNMERLKVMKNKALIVAVGSSIKLLDMNGITPHIRVAFDGSSGEGEIFENIDTASAPLIFCDRLYSPILSDYKGRLIRMFATDNRISKYIHDMPLDSESDIAVGHSVAHIAFDLLVKTGIKKIIFTGQDLCFSGGRYYAKGWRDDPIDFEEPGGGYSKTVDNYGNEVYTNIPFSAMRLSLEELIAGAGDVNVINATAGGVVIKGAEFKNLDDVIREEPDVPCRIENIIDEVFTQEACEPSEEKVRRRFEDILKFSNEIKLLNDESIRVSEKLINLLNYNNKSLKKISEEFEKLKALDGKLVDISFYKDVITVMQSTNILKVDAEFYYAGDDNMERLKYSVEAYNSRSKVLAKYTKFICDELTDYKI